MGVEQPSGGALLRRRHIFWGMAVGAAVLVVLTFFFWERLAEGIEFFTRILDREEKERFRAWIHSFGPWGPFVFIAIQVVQVVLFPIPGELTAGFLGGYIYGVWLATVYSTVGLSLGSWLAFLLGRLLGRPFVERLIPRNVLDKFDFLVAHKGAYLALILFAIPTFPKDYMCYLLGLSPLRTRVFLFVAALGRIPATFMFVLQGANLYEERYGFFFALLIILLAIAALTTYFREPIRLWLRTKARGEERPSRLS